MPAKNRQMNDSSPEANEPATTTARALTLMLELLNPTVWSVGSGIRVDEIAHCYLQLGFNFHSHMSVIVRGVSPTVNFCTCKLKSPMYKVPLLWQQGLLHGVWVQLQRQVLVDWYRSTYKGGESVQYM